MVDKFIVGNDGIICKTSSETFYFNWRNNEVISISCIISMHLTISGKYIIYNTRNLVVFIFIKKHYHTKFDKLRKWENIKLLEKWFCVFISWYRGNQSNNFLLRTDKRINNRRKCISPDF